MQNSCGGWGGGFAPHRGGGFCLLGFIVRHKKLVLAAAVVAGAIKVVKFMEMRRLRAKWNSAGKDVVVLHTIPRGNFCPSMSPFPLKLETFFRMMDIKYELDYKMPMGPKNKFPWITLNGEDYTDSELIVQTLQVKFNKFPDANVPKEDRAVGLAMQIMVEEYLYWGGVSWRWLQDKQKNLWPLMDIPLHKRFMLKTLAVPKLKRALYGQGLGRHSKEDLEALMKRALDALSTYLGEKQFMYGDEPHVVDCAIFGMMAQIVYNSAGSSYLAWVNDDFPNLRPYTERMRERFWPDWNQLIKKPNITLTAYTL